MARAQRADPRPIGRDDLEPIRTPGRPRSAGERDGDVADGETDAAIDGLLDVRSHCFTRRPAPPAGPNPELVTLADDVVRRLLAVGLATRSLLAHIDDPDLALLAERIVVGLDATINEIRSTVFELQTRGTKPERA